MRRLLPGRTGLILAGPILAGLILAGCTVGPDYQQPAAPEAPAFKELQGWTPSHPADAIDKGAWWSVYNDPELDRLERMVDISNQTIKSYEAQYRNAVALVAEARAGLFPTISVGADATRTGSGAKYGVNSSGSGNVSRNGATYTLSGNVDWDLDVWGRIRRQIESSTASAQVSAADLANARLSAQATLAVDYFNLRAEDALAKLLTETVEAYRQSLRITDNQYKAGTASSIDYVTALTQLQSTQAQLIAVGVQRAQYEHAIAVLTGQPPSSFSLSVAPLATDVPVVPAGIPSTLLQRRPDIAAAERNMQALNAQIGVAIAAYYPDISLSALGEVAGSPVSQLFNLENRFWSLAATGAETVFNGGLRSAEVEAARTSYEQGVANYRQTVLTAFQQVEDALSALRVLQLQAGAQDLAVASARRAVTATLNAYKAGTVAYTSVIVEQATLLSNEQSALAVRQSRLVQSVNLIQALGGGWQAGDLPSVEQMNVPSPLRP
ncbi:efflux transporter outer membrane subunit [Rhodopila sp.]|uniref:efflux transporter outer membrane subunit n=1 Tax=Rhodopila sp. TaxID=2480087 RepID=UPI002CA9A3F9|nr:efflux transporter outer membrane subunit [Rhodopila sp.]HVZ08293.1 efflux transporter outer membrane subunit [Rhodopila sp.]